MGGYRNPELWPSIMKASALLLSLEARGGVREHLTPIADDDPPPPMRSAWVEHEFGGSAGSPRPS
jgi:hypothetical protein